MTRTDDFGWGIAATGSMARTIAQTIVAEPGMRVAAVGSRDLGRARTFADEFGAPTAYGSYAELVRDDNVDAVYIATPHTHHRLVAELAFAAGKPVLCEKSLTATYADAEAVVKSARAAGVFLMEAMWMRFNPVIRRAQEVVAAGTIGDIRSVSATFGWSHPYDPAHRLWDVAQGGGALLDLGVYPITFAYLLLGQPQAVHVAGSLAENGVDADAALMMTWSDGARALLETSLIASQPMTATLSGTRGRIDIDAPFHATSGLTVRAGLTTEEFRADGPQEALAGELREVRDCVRQGLTESPVVPLDDTLAIMGILENTREALGAVPYPPVS